MKQLLRLTERPFKMNDDGVYSLVKVRRGNNGVVSRGLYEGKKVLVKSQFKVETDDFIISKRQIVHQACGIVPAELDGSIVSNEYNVFQPTDECCIRYFDYLCYRPEMRHAFFLSCVGVHLEKMLFKTNDWLKRKFHFPSAEEQRKIADFLTAVDRRIGQLSQKKALLEDYKKGVMQQLFTQALRFKDDHGNAFPEWEEKTLGASIDLLSGFPFASEDILDGQTSAERERILLMRGVNITEGLIRHSEDQDRFYCGDDSRLQKYKLEVGDMVIGMDGSKVGKNSALVGEAEKGSLLVQRVARIRALGGTSLPFIYQHVNSFLFHRYVDRVKTSSGIPHISAKQIREFTIGFPCLAEQTKIANFLTALDRKIESVAQQITHTQTFKKGLLQQMFV